MTLVHFYWYLNDAEVFGSVHWTFTNIFLPFVAKIEHHFINWNWVEHSTFCMMIIYWAKI